MATPGVDGVLMRFMGRMGWCYKKVLERGLGEF